MSKCSKCGGQLVFMDDSYEDNYSSGWYICGECHCDFSIEQVEGD